MRVERAEYPMIRMYSLMLQPTSTTVRVGPGNLHVCVSYYDSR